MVQALNNAGFLVLPKLVLDPSAGIFFFGKSIDPCDRKIWSPPRALVQMLAHWVWLATTKPPHPRHLNKVLRFFPWHVRPRKGMGPFLAGAYCCQHWGPDS